MKIVTKTELMHAVATGWAHESFEHETEGQFDVTLCREYANGRIRPVLVDLDCVLPFIRENRVFEPSRIADLPATSLNDPGIFLIMPDNTHMLIDGTHRALLRGELGLRDMSFYLIPLEDAIRPGEDWGRVPGVDWGDEIIEGKIIKREG